MVLSLGACTAFFAPSHAGLSFRVGSVAQHSFASRAAPHAMVIKAFAGDEETVELPEVLPEAKVSAPNATEEVVANWTIGEIQPAGNAPSDDLKAAAAGLAAGVAMLGVDMFAMDGTLGALGLLLATGVVTASANNDTAVGRGLLAVGDAATSVLDATIGKKEEKEEEKDERAEDSVADAATWHVSNEAAAAWEQARSQEVTQEALAASGKDEVQAIEAMPQREPQRAPQVAPQREPQRAPQPQPAVTAQPAPVTAQAGSAAAATRGPDLSKRTQLEADADALMLAQAVAEARSNADGVIARRVQELLEACFEEWASDRIDTYELERRKEDAFRQAAAEQVAVDTAYADYQSAVHAREAAWEAYCKATEKEQASSAGVVKALKALQEAQ